MYGGIFAAAMLLTFGFVEVGFAEEPSVFKQGNLFNMSLEELSQIEVVSASRQKQKLCATSVPMTVVSKDDVHYSGAANLYELLQFSPSIDMLRVDRNRYALGVRGLHDVYSDRTLVLIN
jgi:iron complex outermembrane receptor protein